MFIFLECNYKVIRGEKYFNYDEVKYLFTDYFLDYDYVLGDYSYGRLRLKGFYDSDNKSVKKLNDIRYLDSYIKEYCSLGANIFLLKKVKK